MQPTGPEIVLGCRTCELAVVRAVPEGFDVRPVLVEFFAEHARCDTYLDLSRAGRAVSRVLLVPPQRTAEQAEPSDGMRRLSRG